MFQYFKVGKGFLQFSIFFHLIHSECEHISVFLKHSESKPRTKIFIYSYYLFLLIHEIMKWLYIPVLQFYQQGYKLGECKKFQNSCEILSFESSTYIFYSSLIRGLNLSN